jgi:CRP/FNR family cyclic AMP-dependent transcriptional regulator
VASETNMELSNVTSTRKNGDFGDHAFLGFAGMARTIVKFESKGTLFTQGDACKDVMYIQEGTVKLSVVSTVGKEAVLAMLKPGDFVGEGALTGQPLRTATATAVTRTTLFVIGVKEMVRVLHSDHTLFDHFLNYLLKRNIRIEEDLIDQLFNSSEKRLARTLLLLSGYGKSEKPQLIVPNVSQETLAEMIGTTRSRVNFFMNKFKKLGFIKYGGGLQVNDSLLNVVLQESQPERVKREPRDRRPRAFSVPLKFADLGACATNLNKYCEAS